MLTPLGLRRRAPRLGEAHYRAVSVCSPLSKKATRGALFPRRKSGRGHCEGTGARPHGAVRVPRAAAGSAGGRTARGAAGLRAPRPCRPSPRPPVAERLHPGRVSHAAVPGGGRGARARRGPGRRRTCSPRLPPPLAAPGLRGTTRRRASAGLGPRCAPRRARRRWQVPQPGTFRSAHPAARP